MFMVEVALVDDDVECDLWGSDDMDCWTTPTSQNKHLRRG